MSEYGYLWQGVGKLLIALLIATIYSLAGRGKIWAVKVRRRVVLPMILLVSWLLFSMIGKTFTLKFLMICGLTYGIYYGFLSVGYGEGSILRKWFGKTAQQFLVGACYGSGCILIGWYVGKMGLVVCNILLNSITLGFMGSDLANEEITAAWKELCIGLMIFTIPLFLV